MAFNKIIPGGAERQRDYRIRDAKHAVEVKQPREEARARNQSERDHAEKVGKIRERELGKQEADMGGTSDVIKKVQ